MLTTAPHRKRRHTMTNKERAEEMLTFWIECGAISPEPYEKHKRIIIESIEKELDRKEGKR